MIPVTASELHIALRSEVSAAVLATEAVALAGWTIDSKRRQLKAGAGKIVHLTHAECRALTLLASNPHQAVTRDRLMRAAVGRGWSPPDRSIDVHISNLRRKLDADPKRPSLIRSVRGVGYMLVPHRPDWTIA